ncbi:MAG: phage integrase N-terminal SAM-like domain-containing protein [Sulfuriferula sp.]
MMQCIVFIDDKFMTHPSFSVDNPTAPPPKLLDRVRDKLRVKHYSRCAEQTYLDSIKRYILFHGKQADLTYSMAYATEKERFLCRY